MTAILCIRHRLTSSTLTFRDNTYSTITSWEILVLACDMTSNMRYLSSRHLTSDVLHFLFKTIWEKLRKSFSFNWMIALVRFWTQSVLFGATAIQNTNKHFSKNICLHNLLLQCYIWTIWIMLFFFVWRTGHCKKLQINSVKQHSFNECVRTLSSICL